MQVRQLFLVGCIVKELLVVCYGEWLLFIERFYSIS